MSSKTLSRLRWQTRCLVRPKTRSRPRCRTGCLIRPFLISEQEVRFSTAAAVPLRPAKITHRLIEAIRVASAALRPPPARRHHPQRFPSLERALMAREMYRL